jgi:predicted nucleotidyltransferase
MSSSAKCGAQSVSAAASPLLEALATLARAGVEFIVVGVSGINFYARDASDAVVTADVDVFLSPRVEVLRSALGALRSSGFEFWADDEPFLDFDDSETLANLIRSGANVTAENEAGARIDLMLSGGGFRYDDLAADAVTFRLGDVKVRVGRLEKLLRSKELAGRPKDVAFLRLFAARLRESAGED